MKNKKLCILFILIYAITFTSCSLNNKKDTSEKSYSSNENIIGKKNNKKEKKPLGEPYTVGVTPDDYNMDYDTSRLKSLNEKKSKYYPEEGVKGVYLNTYTAANPKAFKKIMDLLDNTKLNTVVLDVKDDWGNITCKFDTDNKDIKYATSEVVDAEDFINKMHEKGIYVIGRITTFKDSVITEKHPDWGFTLDDGSLWKNAHDEAFMNPFLKEVQDYDLKIAKLAAQAGFDEIQFDYVRFAEGFETFGDTLDYSKGEFENNTEMDEGEKRVEAITGFVQRAREELQKYDVPISIDVFGYALQVRHAEGIGQDFDKMANQTDVISAMIYPSHWGSGSFDLDKPDLQPYELVKRYLDEEQEVLGALDHPPLSRPWIQDFTASWIGEGNWMEYDADAVQAQIDAIYDQGQNEYLIWNANSEYSTGVDY